jgi:hypothetical protein
MILFLTIISGYRLNLRKLCGKVFWTTLGLNVTYLMDGFKHDWNTTFEP